MESAEIRSMLKVVVQLPANSSLGSVTEEASKGKDGNPGQSCGVTMIRIGGLC